MRNIPLGLESVLACLDACCLILRKNKKATTIASKGKPTYIRATAIYNAMVNTIDIGSEDGSIYH